MRAKVDPDLCNGCGMCVSLCAEVFDFTPSGKAATKSFKVPEGMEEDCYVATQFCPVNAIHILNSGRTIE